MQTLTGDQIVDWYMKLATDPDMPPQVRDMALESLRAFALRAPHQTVEEIDGEIVN